MSASNSKNVSLIVVLLLVIAATFTYVLVSDGFGSTLDVDLNNTEVGN